MPPREGEQATQRWTERAQVSSSGIAQPDGGDDVATTCVGLLILVVFVLHNGWNCFVFLDFAAFPPAIDLLHIDNGKVGLLGTMGWIGILLLLPVLTVCTWHRTLLFIAGAVNALAPALRYYAAVQKNYPVMVLSSVLVGAAYGVIGAWPPMLARVLFPKRRWAVVIAIASLANYFGGAVGVLLLPAIVSTGDDLLNVLYVQMYVGLALGVLTLSWCPPAASFSTRRLGSRSCWVRIVQRATRYNIHSTRARPTWRPPNMARTPALRSLRGPLHA